MVRDWALDLVVVNGEKRPVDSASRGDLSGVAGCRADAITLGQHAWDQREALVFIERAPS